MNSRETMTQKKIQRMNRIRVLLCDDSAFLRVTLRKIIESEPGMQVVDIARNGAEAVDKALRLKPDVITMNVHMPVVDGLDALKDIVYLKLAPVIMLAAPTTEDAAAAIDAMEAGAFDFITKPDNVNSLASRASAILLKIKQAAACNPYRRNGPGEPQPDLPEGRDTTRAQDPHKPGKETVPVRQRGFKAVALGLSTGGPKAIFAVLPHLPGDLNAAIFVVQHMPPPFITTFARRVDNKTQLACVESGAGMKVEPGTIYIAKGDFHLKLMEKNNGDVVIRQSKEPPHQFMPSVDVTMNSVCDLFGNQSVGVLMTGMGKDGARGMERISNAGGMTVVESKETAVVFGMPGEAIKRGAARRIVPNRKIAAEIIDAVM